MSFLVKEMFRTLQGEGRWAGTPSVFVRLAGCNIWSGHEQDRQPDSETSGTKCPLFCDTDFVGGDRVEVDELAERIFQMSRSQFGLVRHVVFTGGEPLVQLNRHPELFDEVRKRMSWPRLAIETNGTLPLHARLKGNIDWICVSPKRRLEELALRSGDELKVVFPSYDPLSYGPIKNNFRELLVSPEFPPAAGSLVKKDILERAVQFCLEHPDWKLSLQQHKYLDIP